VAERQAATRIVKRLDAHISNLTLFWRLMDGL
jgi:hypothetical protein